MKSSPIIAYDGEAAPGYTLYDFRQSTVPGCRTPHLWLRDGISLYDALAPDFTLLRFDRAVDVGPVVEAAAHRRVPLAVVDVESKGVCRTLSLQTTAVAAGSARSVARR